MSDLNIVGLKNNILHDYTNNNIKNKIMRKIAPQNSIQQAARSCIKSLTDKIMEPHCEICGDTEEDGELVHIEYTNHDEDNYFCRMCYDIQKNM